MRPIPHEQMPYGDGGWNNQQPKPDLACGTHFHAYVRSIEYLTEMIDDLQA